MENAEEILQCLDEFSKVKPKDIPRELEEYLCFVAKTGDPIYQWPLIKCLFREKLINVITEFYETCPSVEIPPCPNVDTFNYDSMKTFILEKLDTFAAAPFTVQRICELLTTPRKEYNRIDKYMRALEKNILVVSTREPGNRRNTENGESIVNGLESEHVAQDIINSDINVEVEMDDSSWPKTTYTVQEPNLIDESQTVNKIQDTFISESKDTETAACSSTIETVITSRPLPYIDYPPTTTETATTEPTTTPAETTAVLTPPENITVTITNVTEEDIEQLTEEDEEPQPEGEPPLYVGSINHKDTSIYLGTNENGDQVYRIKYEPYVEIDYMALPETAFPTETVYEGEIKPETTQPVTPTEPQIEPEVQPETEKRIEEPDWERNPPETTITSSDEVITPSETITDVPATPKPENQEPVVDSSVPEIKVITEEIQPQEPETTEPEPEKEVIVEPVEETPVVVEEPTTTVVETTVVETTVEEPTVPEPPAEAMEVDEPVVSESEPQTQEPVVSQTDSTTENTN